MGAGPDAPAAVAGRPEWDLPERPPTAAERIDFFLVRATSGDPEEESGAWREIVAAGHAAEGPLRAALAEALGESPVRAEKLLAAFPAGVSVDPVLPLVLSATESRDGRVRLAAVRALAGSRDRAAIPALVDRVGDGITVVASAALEELEARASVSAARAIRGRFPARVNGAPEIRRRALRFAGRNLPLEEAKGLLGSQLGSREPSIAIAAAQALAERGDDAGTRALRGMLEAATDGERRLAILSALAAAHAPDAVAPLRRMAAGSDRELAVGAVVALGGWADGPAREVLRELAIHGSGEVRREACHELLRAGDPEGAELVRGMLTGPASSRRTAAALVGSSRARTLAGDLESALEREEDPGVRLALAAALSVVGDETASPVLAGVLVSEPNDEAALSLTAHNAAQALLRLPGLDDEAVRMLVAAAGSGGAGVRLNAIRVLGGFGRGPAAIRAALADPSAGVRIAAASAWARLPDAALPPLESAFAGETDADAARALLSAAKMVYYRWQR